MVRILQGDCTDILPTLEAGSVQCCVTSPPYWGLRDYGTALWEGGSAECDHLQNGRKPADWSSSGLQRNKKTPELSAGTIALVNHQQEPNYRQQCGKCGARRIDSQLGLESTPEEYIAKMVAVFREVWRVLRDDGTLWVNMGDSYASSGLQSANSGLAKLADKFAPRKNARNPNRDDIGNVPRAEKFIPVGLKPKDLCGIPWRLAFALQSDGWYLRSDIIWKKPNPMPESCTDRPTKSHEYIFLLAKQEKYFYDANAIREPSSPTTNLRVSKAEVDRIANARINGNTSSAGKLAEPKTVRYDGLTKNNESFTSAVCLPVENRNKRSVWTIATQPYSEAHFATFPEDLIKPCIMAGSRIGDTVLDPFAGSGTTGKVALELGRKAILIELNPKYIEMIQRRTDVTPSML